MSRRDLALHYIRNAKGEVDPEEKKKEMLEISREKKEKQKEAKRLELRAKQLKGEQVDENEDEENDEDQDSDDYVNEEDRETFNEIGEYADSFADADISELYVANS